MHATTFVDFDICHRMASLRRLYSVTLTYFFKVIFLFKNVNISDKVRACAKMNQMIFIDFDICQQITPLPKLYSLSFTYFFQGHKFKMLISLTVRARAKIGKD